MTAARTDSMELYVRRTSSDVVARARAVIRDSQADDSLAVSRAILGALGDQSQSLLSLCFLIWVEREQALARRSSGDAELPASAPRPVGTSTATRVRDWYSQQMNSHVAIHGRTVTFGNCTAEDLHTIAAERYRVASHVKALGDQWSEVAFYMEKNGITRVSEIPRGTYESLVSAEKS